jgi:hypothetical protein
MNRDFGGEPVDRPVAVRPGEELDVERLGPYLEDALGVEGEIGVRQYPSGYSNLTYLVRIGDAEFVLRRPPFGSKPKSGHDMQREHTVLSALHESFPYCPEPLLYCDDPSVIGSPFYVMQRLEGIIVRRDFPPELSLSPADVRSLFSTCMSRFTRWITGRSASRTSASPRATSNVRSRDGRRGSGERVRPTYRILRG